MKIGKIKRLLCATLLILVLTLVNVGSLNVSAATNQAGVYTISGSYNIGDGTVYGYLDDFRIAVSTERFRDDAYVSTFYNDKIFDWTYISFYLHAGDIDEHSSFTLTRNGSIYISNTLSGDGDLNLYKGRLPDGNYVLTYVGKYKDGLFSKKTYTFTYRFRIDTNAPSASLTAGGSYISSGSYTNKAIKFSASDTYTSCTIYYRSPGSSSYSSTTASSKSVSASASNNGWWYFYAGDGYQSSSTYSVYLDTVSPVGKITNSSGTTLSSGSYTNKPVKYTATDAGGISYLQVFTPTASSWANYSSGTALSSSQGWYYFRAVDHAGNTSGTSSVYYDATAPTGTLYSGNSVKSSGSYTNASSIKYSATDAHSGVSACYVKKPGSSSYVSYTNGSQLTAEGTYSFYCVDFSGNQSATVSITLDRTIPTAELFVDGEAVPSDTYTNGEYIFFESDGNCYVKLPDSTSFSQYVSGTEYDKPGKYVFYAQDAAGNNTGEYSIVIDRTVKDVWCNNVLDGKTDGDVTVSWKDGDADIYAPITKVTVNGVDINNGSVIHTINTGTYEVIATDAAGNVWTLSFTSTKKNVLTDTLVREYYDVENTDGMLISYASYDNALDYARSVEKGYVSTGVWNGSSWDGGIAMDTKDSVNAANGTYYVYKKSGGPDEQVAYFTLDRLNEVIDEYARQRIETCYYCEKEPENIAVGEKLYTDAIIANSITLGDNVTAYLDGNLLAGNSVEAEGAHTLTVKDNYGNSCDYSVTVVRTIPDIMYSLGSGSWNRADPARVYHFKENVTVTLNDLYDDMAMMYVHDETAGTLNAYFKGDNVSLTNSGSYNIIAVNHAGETDVLTVIISHNAPSVTFTDNEEEKRLDIEITESEDIYSHIQTLEILKSTDNGQTWQTVNVDDYGTEVSAQRLKYSFRTSGIYKIILTDEFRTGIDAVSVQYAYGQKAPAGILMGVQNGGHTNGAVSFEWYDEAVVTVTKDGEVVKYRSSSDLREDGHYVITIENFDGMKNTYSFTIDTEDPTVSLNGVENGGTVNTDVSLDHADSAKLYKNGELVGEYASGTAITDEGEYRIVVSDLAGNAAKVSFSIDKTAPIATLGGVDNGGITKGKVTLTEPDEEVNVKVYFNDEEIEYVKGDKFTSAGAYKILVSDIYGNATEYNFEILESANGAVIALIVIGIIAALGVVAVVILKKKKLF